MHTRTILLAIAIFACSLVCQRAWINAMRRMRLGETIKGYGPKSHAHKGGTPGMGGIVALGMTPLIVLSACWYGMSSVSDKLHIWAYPVASALVGLVDDLLKMRRRSSEGLRSLQKLTLQIAVTAPWAYVAASEGLYLLPWLRLDPAVGIPLLIFLGVGILNAVNVTDGLDGLAGGSVAISLASILLWTESEPAAVSASLGLAVMIAFLWHNSNPAEVFMGDVGSHLWAGVLITLCVASKSLILVIPVSFIFGVEMVTVAVQIAAIRIFGRRVFRMSPLHHHFELIGWSEPKIVTRFWLAHVVGMSLLAVIINFVFRGGAGNAGG
ncbi:MAG: phospho-N-acetylmuramoyl-pentapeptide-transferase [Synergistaceae bacterium]|jgi:phospho-N-acetylmuramoyl-pentapeptide-transferase|nr:phospho-N-acetylmuramoyl-pentapeptide-transferase [Synergistaceae bacterium]